MGRNGVTNDDLVAFLARKRETEVYRGWSDSEILRRERTKLQFVSVILFAMCLWVARGVWRLQGHFEYLIAIPVLLAIALPIAIRDRRMRRFSRLYHSRPIPKD
jgi:hypothetical protein